MPNNTKEMQEINEKVSDWKYLINHAIFCALRIIGFIQRTRVLTRHHLFLCTRTSKNWSQCSNPKIAQHPVVPHVWALTLSYFCEWLLSLPETTSSPCARGTPMVADGSHGDGKDLVCRVPKVGHTANLFAMCIYRRTAKKSEQTPSRPADGIGGCSPCACTVDTRWTSSLRCVPLVLAHGKIVWFAVCLVPSTQRTMVSSPCARPMHTANLVSRAGQIVTFSCA